MQEFYFKLKINFDHLLLHKEVRDCISSSKGYICVVDANVLTMAQSDSIYRKVINSALINTCDGSSIAMMAGWIHKRHFIAYNGPTLFNYYIEKPYKHLLLGSTDDTSERIKSKVKDKGIDCNNIISMPLPFCSVDDFDYPGIATDINKINPDIIWVSLGAPKQEFFMNKILPYLNRGVMFGIGAAFNFYTGDLRIPKFQIGKLRLIWLSRLISEPRKLLIRIIPYLIIMPKLIIEEKLRVASLQENRKRIKKQL